MKLIDNVNELLGDDFKEEFAPGAKVRIAASTFSIFAFEALRKELEQVGELEFIFTAPSFAAAKATLSSGTLLKDGNLKRAAPRGHTLGGDPPCHSGAERRGQTRLSVE